jgi:molecular chaperone GrpE
VTDKRRHRHHDEAAPAAVDDTRPPAPAEAPPASAETPPASDAPAPPAAPASSEGGLEAVEEPLTREAMALLRQERNDLRDQLLRKRADFENYRKRVERDRQQAAFDAKAAIFREIIPTLDNLDSALKAGGDADALRTGVELTRRELLGLLETHGIVADDPTGGSFDPEIHQALSHEAVPGFADGTVVEVFRKGYRLKDRLLRPALVKVAKGGGPGGEDTSDGIH